MVLPNCRGGWSCTGRRQALRGTRGAGEVSLSVAIYFFFLGKGGHPVNGQPRQVKKACAEARILSKTNSQHSVCEFSSVKPGLQAEQVVKSGEGVVQLATTQPQLGPPV
jgi:hypothetical protein